MTGSTSNADTDVRPSVGSTSNTGEHDKFAHYVVGGTAAVTRALVTGEPCTALCGKVWTPGSNGAGYKVCPTCEDLSSNLGANRFENW